MVEGKLIKDLYVPTTENKADCLTKILSGDLWECHRIFLGVLYISEKNQLLKGHVEM